MLATHTFVFALGAFLSLPQTILGGLVQSQSLVFPPQIDTTANQNTLRQIFTDSYAVYKWVGSNSIARFHDWPIVSLQKVRFHTWWSCSHQWKCVAINWSFFRSWRPTQPSLMIMTDGVCQSFHTIWSSEYLLLLAATIIDSLDTMARHRIFIMLTHLLFSS